MVRGALGYAAKVCGLAALYAAAARTSFALAFVNTSIAPVWLPSGLAVAAVARFGYRALPGVWLGAFAFNALTPVPLWVAALIAVGNALEGATAGWLLRRAGFDPAVDRVRDVLALAGLGALVAPTVSASVGVSSLLAGGVVRPDAVYSSWVLWWSGDAVGVLTLAPALLLAASARSDRPRRALRPARLVEVGTLAAVLAPVGWVGLTVRPLGPFLVFPVLVWAAIRFRRAGANLASLSISAVVVYATAHGVGPFVAPSLEDALLATQSFVAVVVATGLLLAATTIERERTTEALRDATAELELRNDEIGRRNSELEAERARLDEAQRIAHLGSWEWDVGRDVVRWSAEMHRVFGVPPGMPLTYRSYLDRVHPEDRDRVDRAVREAFGAGAPFGFEHRIVRPDGDVRVMESHGAAIRAGGAGGVGGAGAVVRMVGTGLDITERRRAEDALRAQQDRTQAIIDTASDAFVSMDGCGRITGWNRSAQDLFGWPADEAIGRTLADTIIPSHLRQAHTDGLRRVVAGGRSHLLGKRIDIAASHRDGHEIPVELAVWRVRSGDSQHFHAFLHDISERLRAERTLAVARDEAVAAARRGSQFLATMSHEIRTPMNGVIGLAGLLLAGPLSAEQRRRVEGIRGAGETLLAIINDILDFSRVEAGRMVIDEVDFDLGSALEQVTGLLAEEARVKGLTLVATRRPGVPTALRGDPVRIRQVVLNLVANALKFTERGGVRVEARLDGPADAAGTADAVGTAGPGGPLPVRIDVIDTGIGIDPDALERLFDPFVQADAATARDYGGTGLGLAICRRLAEAMGGRLEASSRAGHGSTFSCVIPLAPAAGRRAPGGNERLLLVEDNKLNQIVAVESLSRLGYRVDVAPTGRQAIDMAQRTRYAAILMDCQMPGMDGYTATAELRRLERGDRHTPIIAMTAGAFDEDRERCLAAGMDDFIAKPIDLDHLAATVARWADRAPEAPRSSVSA